MPDKFIVDLNDNERAQLLELVNSGGNKPARTLTRARILLMADNDEHTDAQIVAALHTSSSTVHRIRQRFVEDGLHDAIYDRPRPGTRRKMDGKEEALLVAVACSPPPKGRARWTLKLLADRLVALTDHDSLSAETIRRRLLEKSLKPWQKKMWCLHGLEAAFIAQMEHILDLYAQPADPKRPVVNFDETHKQLVGEVRVPVPVRPGRPARYDSHYRRNGSANLFVFFDRHRCWRHVKVTQRRANADFAVCMRELVDVHYPEAEVIRVVLDNLSIHTETALYQTFPPAEARRILRRLEFHYTPKHASWLNMVEIEIGVLVSQCLNRRIPDRDTLAEEVAAWVNERNEASATIKWLFSLEDARSKLARAYPNLSQPLR